MNYQQEFELDPGVAYLNHAAVAPWPRRTREAVAAFALENTKRGAQHYPKWLQVEKSLRQRLQRLVAADSVNEIALLKSTSEGLSSVAHGIDWQAGDVVVISNQEFPSNRIVWESLARFGVEVVEADISTPGTETERVIDTCEQHGRTRLLAISSVQYASGQSVDLERLGAYCQDQGVLFCVDAIQSLGVLPFDNQKVQADFIVADGHKWMLGPEGLALFYCKQAIQDTLTLHQYGWHMVHLRGDYDRKTWEPAHNATRFECGSPNMLGCHALDASLSLLEEVGMETVQAALQERTQYLIEALRPINGVRFLSPTDPAAVAGIVTVAMDGVDHQALHQRLLSQNVVCAYRGGGIRFSPHFYTPMAALDKAIDALKQSL